MIKNILSIGCALLLMSTFAKSEQTTNQGQSVSVNKIGWHELSDFGKSTRATQLLTTKRKQDVLEAHDIYLFLYSQGDEYSKELAPFMLGSLYAGLEDFGLERDYQQAIKWLTISATAGHPRSQYSLGLVYQNGENGQSDFEKAEYWLLKAANQGVTPAYHRLGLLYGTVKQPPDYERAFNWTKLAAIEGSPEAQYNFAVLNALGNGNVKNKEAAYYWALVAQINIHKSKISKEEVDALVADIRRGLTDEERLYVEKKIAQRPKSK